MPNITNFSIHILFKNLKIKNFTTCTFICFIVFFQYFLILINSCHINLFFLEILSNISINITHQLWWIYDIFIFNHLLFSFPLHTRNWNKFYRVHKIVTFIQFHIYVVLVYRSMEFFYLVKKRREKLFIYYPFMF